MPELMPQSSKPAKSVLVVDDDEDALQLLSLVMEKSGYTVLTATNGNDAITAAEEQWNEVQAIVLDLMMPGSLDGYDVCRRLRGNKLTSSIPIIILSARSSSQDMALSYEAGAYQHIGKPYDIQHLMAVVQRMVRLRQLEQESTINSDKYRAIVDCSPLEMLLVSPDLRILEMNSIFKTHFPNAAIGDCIRESIYEEELEDIDKHPIMLVLSTGKAQHGDVCGVSDGKPVNRRVHAAPIFDQKGNLSAIVDITEDVTHQHEMEKDLRKQIERHTRALRQQDITSDHLMNTQRELKKKNQELEETNQKLEEAKQELERLSVTDELTGLSNRRYFEASMKNEVRRSIRYNHPLSLLMMDIDHFKEVNDTYLHTTGDVVLKDLADIFHVQLRETDTIARYGGEEFVAILPETGIDIATQIGERLRKTIEEHTTEVTAIKIKVTVSIGVASAQGKIDPEALLKAADTAMYKAKKNGRNRVETTG